MTGTASAARGEFTPGPWEAIKGLEEADKLRCGVSAVRGSMRYLVATIENGAPGDICDTEWANAQLVAAAPFMFEQFETLADLLSEEMRVRGCEEGSEIHSLLVVPLRLARAAIAKATGK